MPTKVMLVLLTAKVDRTTIGRQTGLASMQPGQKTLLATVGEANLH